MLMMIQTSAQQILTMSNMMLNQYRTHVHPEQQQQEEQEQQNASEPEEEEEEEQEKPKPKQQQKKKGTLDTDANRKRCWDTWRDLHGGDEDGLELRSDADGYIVYHCTLCADHEWTLYRSPSSVKQHCAKKSHEAARRVPRKRNIDIATELQPCMTKLHEHVTKRLKETK